MRTTVLLPLVPLLAVVCCRGFAADPSPDDSPRRTATVRLVEGCLPSVAAIRCFQLTAPGVHTVGWGSGSVIHPAGYVLTNDHVLGQAPVGDAMLPGLAPLPFRIVARLPHEDMALIKIDAGRPLKRMPLGRSHDLMLGEPTIAIGNPDGIAHTVSTGIVSGLDRTVATPHSFLPHLVQTDAAVSGGSSGGPLINALGQQIGMVSGKRQGAENINFAIVVDHVRTMFPRMLAVEDRYGFHLGIDVDMLAPSARVAGVAAGSPAALAGVQVNDVVRQVADQEIEHGVDFLIALVDRQPGQPLPLLLDRGGRSVPIEVALTKLPGPATVAADGLLPGLRFAVYVGEWKRLPDVGLLQPLKTGRVDRASLASIEPPAENFAVRFTGYVRIPAAGLYTFSTTSDDGSRLAIADRLVVDNDGLHGTRESSGIARLEAGLHPITIDFFQGSGEQVLDVSIEGPNLAKRPLAADVLFVPGEPNKSR